MARLVFRSGGKKGEAVELPDYACVLGRDEHCDIILADPRSSRQHACIRERRGAWVVRDLGTNNGTFVDGERADDWTRLRHGVHIRIGRTVLKFDTGAADEAVAQQAAPVGLQVPGFDLLESIGNGATGVVYRARQLSLQRVVAMKVLSSKLAADPVQVERFVREAQAAAELSHPHVVPVYDVGEHEGTRYFTMELMEQGTVEDRLLAARGGKLPWRDAVAMVSAAAIGLAHIHEHGLVHRDIKPANLLLDVHGVVKLGDLGTLTREDEGTRARIGTPHFMSPEQAQRRPVTRASDVYAMGATLYRLLSGQTPHHGRNVEEIVRNVATEVPPPIQAVRPGLPAEVVDVVNQMMARDPTRRPTDAADVGRRLAMALAGVHQSREATRGARRRRSATTQWAVRGAVLVASLIGIWLLREPVMRALREASAPTPETPAESAETLKDADEPPPGRSPNELASEAYYALASRERAFDPPARRNAKEWREVADEYARLAQVYPLGSEYVIKGHWRAREIRGRLALVTGGDATNAEFADRMVGRSLEKAGLDDVDVAAAPAPGRGRPLDDADAMDPLRAARDAVIERAEGLLRNGHVERALDTVLDWVREERVRARQTDAPDHVHETIAEAIGWMRRTARRTSARLESELESDRALLRIHLPVTNFFRGHDGAPDPGAAIARLDALDPLLVTYLGADVVAQRRGRLVAARGAWDVVRDTLPAGAAEPSTADAVADATTSALSVIPTDRVAGAVWLLLEARRPALAAAALGRRPEVPTAVGAAAMREIIALRGLLALGRAPSGGALAKWRLANAAADAALLAPPTLAAGHPMFSADDVETFYETWGGTPPAPK